MEIFYAQKKLGKKNKHDADHTSAIASHTTFSHHFLPENAAGTYVEGTTEVTYYYVEKQIPLTVHHYIEGTTDKVPLKAGGTASDVTGSGKEGESYTTSAIANDKLSDEYELVEIPSNANGTYSGNEVIVTYYYKKVERKVNLVKYKEDAIYMYG